MAGVSESCRAAGQLAHTRIFRLTPGARARRLLRMRTCRTTRYVLPKEPFTIRDQRLKRIPRPPINMGQHLNAIKYGERRMGRLLLRRRRLCNLIDQHKHRRHLTEEHRHIRALRRKVAVVTAQIRRYDPHHPVTIRMTSGQIQAWEHFINSGRTSLPS